MRPRARVKQALLIAGDLAIMAGALAAAVYLRGRGDVYGELLRGAWPWTVVIAGWTFIFWLSGLYDVRRLRNDISFLSTFVLAVGMNLLLAIAFFYAIPAGIAPKTTLVIFAGVYLVPALVWRRAFNRFVVGMDGAARTLVLGGGPVATELVATLRESPRHGYRVVAWRRGEPDEESAVHVPADVEVAIVPRRTVNDPELAAGLYGLLARGVIVRRLDDVYEEVFGKVPLPEVDETWLLEHASRRLDVYTEFHDLLTYALAVVLQVLFLPLEILIAVAIKLTSPGPVIYRQVRTGRDGKPFTLYKFRTMRTDAEKDGPQWSGEGDSRVTAIGRLLRYTHVDEFPQLWNVLRGEIAFVGPRPERPEFEETLEKQIPHYRVRHLVKPGITGWAQVSYPYGSAVEHAYQKLQYDLHYLRYRSVLMDAFVLLKTVKTLVATPRQA